MKSLSWIRTGKFAAALCGAAALSGCGDENAAGSRSDEPHAGPVYALHLVVFSDNATTSYVLLTDDIDLDRVSLDDAREFADWVSIAAIDGSLLVAPSQAPTITSYSIVKDLAWKEGETLSFGNTGVESAGFWDEFFLDEHTAYLTVEETKRVVWDPTSLRIHELIDDSTLLPQTSGVLQIEAGFQRQPWFPSRRVLKPFYYRDADWFQFSPSSHIVAYDPETHAVSTTIEAPCPALEAATEDEDGNTYFSTWNLGPAQSLYGVGPAPCVARVTPENTLDESFAPAFDEWTGGRPTLTWRYVRDGKGIGTVLDTEATGADFTQPYDEMTAERVDSGSFYRLWLFDLENESARPIEGVAPSVSNFHWANFGDRTFVFMPYDGYGRTRVYEVNLDGTAREAFDTIGWLYEWVRVQ